MPVVLKVPNNWPRNITFLTTPRYSKTIQPNALQVASSSASSLPIVKAQRGSSPTVRIRRIVNPSHPASGQHGLFAARNLQSDTFICFYLGFVHSAVETDPSSNYDLSLNRDSGIGVDATSMGNEARFINDYRGIQDGPNAEFRDCLAEVGSQLVERRTGVFVLSSGKKGGKRAKGIGKGEEIVVSYGKGFWSHRRTEQDETAAAEECSTGT